MNFNLPEEEPFKEKIRNLVNDVIVPLPDNFTSPENTPWGGRRIRELKSELQIKGGEIVGESWEISAHKKMPSRIKVEYKNKTYLVPLWYIGELETKALYGKNAPPFLTKLLNAEKDLSVQVHPPKNFVFNGYGYESKTEIWHILDAALDAGLYLGLREDALRENVKKSLEKREDISRYLNFIKVKKDDSFCVPAGTPHAIGAGIFLIEHQETSDATFRFFDWNRKDSKGRSRALHIEEAMKATNWNGPRGDLAWKQKNVSGLSLEKFNFNKGGIYNGDTNGKMEGVTVINGEIEIVPENRRGRKVKKGESAIIPASLGQYKIEVLSKAVELFVGKNNS